MKLVFECFETSDYHYTTYTLEYESKEKCINDLEKIYSFAEENKYEKFQFINTNFYTNSFDFESVRIYELDS